MTIWVHRVFIVTGYTGLDCHGKFGHTRTVIYLSPGYPIGNVHPQKFYQILEALQHNTPPQVISEQVGVSLRDVYRVKRGEIQPSVPPYYLDGNGGYHEGNQAPTVTFSPASILTMLEVVATHGVPLTPDQATALNTLAEQYDQWEATQ